MNFKTKIVVWFFIVVGIFLVEQYVFHSVSPEVVTESALRQMEGIALHTDFTFQDMLKNYLVYFLCFVWTIGIFWNEIWNCLSLGKEMK